MSDIVPTSVPVAPAAPVVAPAAPTAPKPAPVVTRRLGGTERAITTRPSVRTVLPTAVPSPAPAPVTPPTAPAVAAESTSTREPWASPQAVAPVDVDSAAAPVEPKIDAAEESKRIARLRRAEEKHRATIQADRAKFDAERAALEPQLQRAQIVERAFAESNGDPIAFAAKAFGMSIPKFLHLAMDRAIGTKVDPQAAIQQQAAKAEQELRQKIQQLEQSVQTAQQSAAQERQTAEQTAYKQNAIAPIVGKYELLSRALGPQAAAEEIFSLQQKRFQATQEEVRQGKRQAPIVLTPEQAAEQLETYLKKQRDLLTGANVDPAKPLPSSRPGATSVQQTAPQAHNRRPDGRYKNASAAVTVKGRTVP